MRDVQYFFAYSKKLNIRHQLLSVGRIAKLLPNPTMAHILPPVKMSIFLFFIGPTIETRGEIVLHTAPSYHHWK